MNTELNYMIAQQRSAEMQRAGARARLAGDLRPERIPRRLQLTTRMSLRLPRLTNG